MTVIDNRTGRAASSELRAWLDAGHQVTYTPEVTGGFFAILRDPSGRLIECGNGRTQDEARAHLSERLERNAAAATTAEDEPSPLAELDREDRMDMVNVMTAHERAILLAFIAGTRPGVFDSAVASQSETFADELLERIDARDAKEEANEPEGYCSVCGANVSWFIGYEGPQHFRGPHKLITGSERRELFTPDDGHEPAVAWRYPDEPGQLTAAATAGRQQ
jgi:hypothetical protein